MRHAQGRFHLWLPFDTASPLRAGIGGILDAATNLIYVGNGQYYDPTTGRFLTRGVSPESPNPYVPWNPLGAILGPLSLVSLAALRWRGKRNKNEPYWLLILLLVVLPVTVGMACGTPTQPSNPPVETQTPTPVTEVPGPTTVPPTVTPTPTPPTATPTPCNCTPTPEVTPTPLSATEELRTIYQVAISDDFPEDGKSYVLTAVRKVDERFADEMGWARTTAFARVYGIGYLFNWGECDNCVNALAYTQFERIDFRELFTREPGRNPRFIVHELGHAFDQKVCAFYNGGAECADIGTGPIRNRLRADVATRPYLERFDDYGSTIDQPGAPAYYGFAGGQNDWQFTAEGQTNFSLYPGEVWADMFLGWVYENLAAQRMDYMNDVMPEYLSLFN